MASDALLSIRGLHAGYGETEILRGIDLVVGAGEIVAVLGSNGAGKSTLNLRSPGWSPRARAQSNSTAAPSKTPVRPRSSPLAWSMCRKAAAFFPICRLPKISISAAIAGRRHNARQTASGYLQCFPRLRERAANAPERCRAANSRCSPSAAA